MPSFSSVVCVRLVVCATPSTSSRDQHAYTHCLACCVSFICVTVYHFGLKCVYVACLCASKNTSPILTLNSCFRLHRRVQFHLIPNFNRIESNFKPKIKYGLRTFFCSLVFRSSQPRNLFGKFVVYGFDGLNAKQKIV